MEIVGAFHLVTQINTSAILSLFNISEHKDKMKFVSICIAKWKAPRVLNNTKYILSWFILNILNYKKHYNIFLIYFY